jgi:hypothetical protein
MFLGQSVYVLSPLMGTVEFEKVTTPEPDQQTILDYLKVRL